MARRSLPWLRTNRRGRLFHAPFDVVFSSFDVVEPDVIYMSSERASQILTAANVRGVPELVVEILSPGTRRRDETVKRDLYGRAGVTKYRVPIPSGM